MRPTNEDSGSAEAEIAELVDRWLKATQSRDLDALLSMMDDDVMFLPASGPVIRGKSDARSIYQRLFAQTSRVESCPVVEEIVVAGDWAFLTGSDELFLTLSESGMRVHMKGRAISIMRRHSDGCWRFARGINNMARQESPD
jgi:uncharacterized protein (TIGR02246 family)